MLGEWGSKVPRQVTVGGMSLPPRGASLESTSPANALGERGLLETQQGAEGAPQWPLRNRDGAADVTWGGRAGPRPGQGQPWHSESGGDQHRGTGPPQGGTGWLQVQPAGSQGRAPGPAPTALLLVRPLSCTASPGAGRLGRARGEGHCLQGPVEMNNVTHLRHWAQRQPGSLLISEIMTRVMLC